MSNLGPRSEPATSHRPPIPHTGYIIGGERLFRAAAPDSLARAAYRAPRATAYRRQPPRPTCHVWPTVLHAPFSGRVKRIALCGARRASRSCLGVGRSSKGDVPHTTDKRQSHIALKPHRVHAQRHVRSLTLTLLLGTPKSYRMSVVVTCRVCTCTVCRSPHALHADRSLGAV